MIKIGNDGINFPYQRSVLKLLGDIVSNSIDIPSKTRTPVFIRTSAVGSIAIEITSVSFSNVGAADAEVLGTVLKPTETINFNADEGINNKFAANSFTWDAVGSELIIIYIH